jgi:hypothetical protein
VAIGRRDEDFALRQRLAVHGWAARQWSGPAEDMGERAWARRRDVQDDANRRRRIPREVGQDALQRFHPAGRRTDHD